MITQTAIKHDHMMAQILYGNNLPCLSPLSRRRSVISFQSCSSQKDRIAVTKLYSINCLILSNGSFYLKQQRHNLLVLLLNCSVPRGFHYVTEKKEKDSKQMAKKNLKANNNKHGIHTHLSTWYQFSNQSKQGTLKSKTDYFLSYLQDVHCFP